MGSENVWKSGLHNDTEAKENSVISEVLEKDLMKKALGKGSNQIYSPRGRRGAKRMEFWEKRETFGFGCQRMVYIRREFDKQG